MNATEVLVAAALLFLLAPAPHGVAASGSGTLLSLRPRVRSGAPDTSPLCFAHSSPLVRAKERNSRLVHSMSSNPSASPDGKAHKRMAVGLAALLLPSFAFAAGARAPNPHHAT